MLTPHRAARAASMLALAGLFACACAQPVAAQTEMRAPSVDDRTFVADLLQESRAQLALARLARERGVNGLARSTALQTQATWQTLNGRLVSLAMAEGAPVLGSLDQEQQARLLRLGRTRDASLDATYVRLARMGDRNALTMMMQEDPDGNPRLERFLSFARPLVTNVVDLAS
jgi:predicted outer membrane protein